MTFVIATGNAGKLNEMKELLSELDIEAVSMREAGVDIEVDETGATFYDNALLKARALCEATGMPAIADDSGLMVDFLDGAPGVHTKRYGAGATVGGATSVYKHDGEDTLERNVLGEGRLDGEVLEGSVSGEDKPGEVKPAGFTLGERDAYLYLLAQMKDAEQRDAKFVCSIVCYFPDGRIISASGECLGAITAAPRGDGGFGYDPVFQVAGTAMTMAELSPDEKNAVSHRGAALREFARLLRYEEDAG